MTIVMDGNNVLVKIPKYWIKVSHASLKVQITDKAAPGYQVSPAHRDRGDGKGERDINAEAFIKMPDGFNLSGIFPAQTHSIPMFSKFFILMIP